MDEKLSEKSKEKLKKSIKNEETEEIKLAKEYLNDLKRVQADFENYVKRVNKEKEQIMQYTKESMILKFLEVLDNFERALSIKDAKMEQLKEGIDMIHKQCQKLLLLLQAL